MNSTPHTDEQLEPCPFCGGEAIIFKGFLLARQRVVECVKCRARATLYGSGTTEENEARAIKAWNTRARLSADTPKTYHCSCGAACSAEEYITHVFELGHDRGVAAAGVAPTDGDLVRLLVKAISTAVPTLMPERDNLTYYVISPDAFAVLAQVHRVIAKRLRGAATTAAPVEQSEAEIERQAIIAYLR